MLEALSLPAEESLGGSSGAAGVWAPGSRVPSAARSPGAWPPVLARTLLSRAVAHPPAGSAWAGKAALAAAGTAGKTVSAAA